MNVNRTPHRHRIGLAALAPVLLAGILLAGCAGGSGGNPDSRLSLQQATQPLTGASPQLTEIRSQANQLLDGGKDAFDQRIAALKGTPIVVNDWASWCGPCRFEFPFLQSQASRHAEDIAFLGVDSDDSSGRCPTPPTATRTKRFARSCMGAATRRRSSTTRPGTSSTPTRASTGQRP